MNDQPDQPLPPPIPAQPEPGMTSRRHDMATAIGCFVIFLVASLSIIVLLNFLITMTFAFINLPDATEETAPMDQVAPEQGPPIAPPPVGNTPPDSEAPASQ